MIEKTPDPATIQDAVWLACRAPSMHNSQPWHWVAQGSTLHLFADLTRLMTAADPEGRQIYLSCGAVLDHLTVAMSAAGWHTSVQRLPDPHDPLHLAAIDFLQVPQEEVTGGLPGSRRAIVRRSTTGGPSTLRPVGRSSKCCFDRPSFLTMSVFDIVLDDARPSLADASRLTETIRANDPSYAAELSWWTSSFASNDGVPQATVTSAAGSDQVDIKRTFPRPGAGHSAEHTGPDRSKIVVLSTHHEDARLDVLRSGEALSAVLLECTVAGLATCTLTHMTELASSREIVRGLIGQRGTPQLLIRVGQTTVADPEVTPTPRKRLADVLEFHS